MHSLKLRCVVAATWSALRDLPLKGTVLGFAMLSGVPALGQRSTPVQVVHPAGAVDDRFGTAAAVEGDTLVVGAPFDDVDGSTNKGSAHVYRWTGIGWAFEATLTAADGGNDNNFGRSVAIFDDTIVVGAGSNLDQGSAYVFARSGTTWTQQQQLTALDGAADDQFGSAVAISGNSVVVGAIGDDLGANSDQGSAYVFTRSGTTWTEQAKLTASDGTVNDSFGSSIAMSGDTAVVGADGDDVGANSSQGSVYVFVRASGGTTWTQQAQLIASDGQANDLLGTSVAISGDTVAAGGMTLGRGVAYLFVRTPSGTTWSQQVKFTPPDTGSGERFGTSVGISGDTAVVGAEQDSVGANSGQGSAWVFSRIGSKWIGPDLRQSGTGTVSNDNLGTSLAISGDTMVVGVPRDDIGANADQGSAYVFNRSGSTWVLQAVLVASDGLAGDEFGVAVAISGDTIIVGAHFDDGVGGANQGSAYVFTRSGINWAQQAKLLAADGAAADELGISVAIDGNTVVVGAYVDDVGAVSNAGSAHVFVRSGTSWSQQASLFASDGAANDAYGISVDVDGNIIMVGAYGVDLPSGPGADEGAAYVYVRSGTTWTQQARLIASGAASDLFGASVALEADIAVIGSWADEVGGNTAAGAAYVFARCGTRWTQVARLTAIDGAAGDRFGVCVGLSNSTAVVGAPLDDVGAGTDVGSIYTFDTAYDDLPVACNLTQGTIFPSLSAAINGSSSGNQILATPAAFRQALPTLDTGSRTLTLNSTGPIRRPFTSTTVFQRAATLAAAANQPVELFGTFQNGTPGVSADVTIIAGTFRTSAQGVIERPNTLSDWILRLSMQFDCAINQTERFDFTGSGGVRFDGGATEQLFEVMSLDIGPLLPGLLERNAPGRFPIEALEIGSLSPVTTATVRLVDAHDNDGLGQSACEAVYVDSLFVRAGSRLINPTCKVYYRTLQNLGTIDFPANVIPLGCGSQSCGTATALPLNGTVLTGSNVTGGCSLLPGTGVNLVDGPSAWYSFVGTGNDVTVTTCSASTPLDTVLHVYCAPNSCLGPFNRVGGNDDGAMPCTLAPRASTVTVPTMVGTSYFVLVNGRDVSVNGSATGSFEISATQGGPSGPVACMANCDVTSMPFDVAETEACGALNQNTTCPTALTSYTALGLTAKGSVSTNTAGNTRDFDYWRLPAAAAGTTVGIHVRSENPMLVSIDNYSVGCTMPTVVHTALIPACADLAMQQFTVALPATGANYILVTTPQFNGGQCSLGLDEYRFQVAPPCTPPVLSGATPASQMICSGSSAMISVGSVSGSPTPTLQWMRDGNPIPGATSATLVIGPPVGPLDVGTYTCVATNLCGSVTSNSALVTLFCPADFNCSGVASVQDIFDFLAAYFAADARADFNRSGTISVQDIFDFLAAYFAGCA